MDERLRTGGPASAEFLAVVGIVLVGAVVGFAAFSGLGTAGDTVEITECTEIDESGEYELVENVSTDGTCIEIVADDVVLDGQDHEVGAGGSGDGIEVDGATNVTITDVTATDSWAGIGVYDATEVTIEDTTASGNDNFGVQVRDSQDVTVEGVTATGNDGGNADGIWITRSDEVTLTDNQASDNARTGIMLDETTNATLRDNSMADNGEYGLVVRDRSMQPDADHYRHDIDGSNTVDGDEVYYLVDESGVTIDASDDPGYLAVVDSEDVTVSGVDLTNAGPGLAVVNSTDVTVDDVTATDNWGQGGLYVLDATNVDVEDGDYTGNTGGAAVGVHGSQEVTVDGTTTPDVEIGNSTDVTVREATIEGGGFAGVNAYDAENVVIEDNEITDQGGPGIQLGEQAQTTVHGVTDVVVENNTIEHNDDEGIHLTEATDTELRDNEIRDNTRAGIHLIDEGGNLLVDNVVENNGWWGVYLETTAHNTLYSNEMSGNDGNFFVGQPNVDWTEVEHYEHEIPTNNTVDGDPIHYLVDESDVTIDASDDPGFVAAVNSEDITVENVDRSGESYGTLLVNTTDSTVTDSTVQGSEVAGVMLFETENVAVSDNEFTDIGGTGTAIHLYAADENDVIGNDLFSTDSGGIELEGDASRNTVADNELDDVDGGTSAAISVARLAGDQGSENVIEGNELTETGGTAAIYVNGPDTVVRDNHLSDVGAHTRSGDGAVSVRADDALVEDTTIEDSDHHGIAVISADRTTIENVTVTGSAEWDFYASGEPTGTGVTELTLATATVDFEGTDLKLRDEPDPAADPPDRYNVGQFVEIEGTSDAATADLDVWYDDGDVDEVDESTLRLWRYDEDQSAWREIDGSSVDTDDGVVSADFEAFGTVAPMGEEATPYFAVEIDETNSPVTEGSDLEVNATVENAGAEAGTQDVHFGFDEELEDTEENLSLDPGEDEALNFTYDTTGETDGDYEVGVSTENATAIETVSIGDFSYFAVEIDETNSPVTEGETLEVDATVENTGETVGEQDVEFWFDEERQETEESLSLDPGANESLSFTYDTTGEEPAEYTVAVVTENETDSESVEIQTGFTVEECREIDQSGTYDLADDLTDEGATNCITITADDVTFDGGGHAVDGVDQDGTGILVDGGSEPLENVTVTDTTITNWSVGVEVGTNAEFTVEEAAITEHADWAVQANEGATVTAAPLDIGESTAPKTTVSFEGENVSVGATEAPPATGEDLASIDRYLETANVTDEATLDVEIQYEAGDVEDLDEEALALWRYDEAAAEWQEVDGSEVDTTEQTVSADLAAFDVVAPMAEEPTDSLEEQWSFEGESRSQYASPAVDGDYAFVGGLGEPVRALDREDGGVAWTFDREGSLADSSPAVHDGTVHVGSGGGVLYALDAADGSVEWTVETDSAIVSSPAVVDGTVYVASNDGTVRAVDAADGTVEWAEGVDSPVYSDPAVADGTVHVAADDGTLYALDADTGSEEWTFDAGAELGTSSPEVADSTVYLAGDEVYALDAADGSVEWQTSYGEASGSSPTLADGTLYVGDADGTLWALLAADGSVAWTYEADDEIASTPAVGGDRVVVGSLDGYVYELDAGDGSEIASASLGSPTRSSPAIADGEVYLGSEDGTVLALTTGVEVE